MLFYCVNEVKEGFCLWFLLIGRRCLLAKGKVSYASGSLAHLFNHTEIHVPLIRQKGENAIIKDFVKKITLKSRLLKLKYFHQDTFYLLDKLYEFESN